MSAKEIEKDIIVFGDSITQGFWDSQGGWTMRLKQYFDNLMVSAPGFPDHGFYYMVYPLGIPEETTQKLLERFEFETEKRMSIGVTSEILVFAIGVNDTAFLDASEYTRNIKEIINRAKRLSSEIAFLEVAPVDERITQPVPWDEDCFYTNEKIEAYNKILKECTEGADVECIPLYQEWVGQDYKELLADGVHPNNAGHQKIFEKVKDFLVGQGWVKV